MHYVIRISMNTHFETLVRWKICTGGVLMYFCFCFEFCDWELQSSRIQYENLVPYVISIPIKAHFETSCSPTSVR